MTDMQQQLRGSHELVRPETFQPDRRISKGLRIVYERKGVLLYSGLDTSLQQRASSSSECSQDCIYRWTLPKEVYRCIAIPSLLSLRP